MEKVYVVNLLRPVKVKIEENLIFSRVHHRPYKNFPFLLWSRL